MTFPRTFLWGASTSPHQTEGNNINSDWWAREGLMPGMEPSGDANDSYHRYREDMQLVAEAGLNSYRFGVEWARVEPRPGEFSRAELAHYRRMIEHCFSLGLTPVVTLHHFSNPRWFAERGGWMADDAPQRFVSYIEQVAAILDGVEWVITINEPNQMAMMTMLQTAAKEGTLDRWQSPTVQRDTERSSMAASLPIPEPRFGRPFIVAHHAARSVLHARTQAKIGWSIANGALTPTAGNEDKFRQVLHDYEDMYLEACAGDDFVAVQSYSTQEVDESGLVPHADHPDNTLVGTAYRPDALGMAVRHTAEVTGLPILVTENGIATSDDSRRIAYTTEALQHLASAMDDGIDVRGYLHWSLLDNYEWGHWGPTFGLASVDRTTFIRTPKPSLAWLGAVAASNGTEIA